jgi:NAD(P)H-dependent FMN reductase
MTIKLLAICGSTRVQSYNRKLLDIAASEARRAGAQVEIIDLKALALPFFDEDLEAREGIVPPAMQLKQKMLEADGFIIASPEYNGSFSAVLKNAIDWASRQAEGEPVLACFANKWVSLLSASPGSLGGLRGLLQLRTVLAGLGCIVLPRQIGLPKAHEAFDDEGQLISQKRHQAVGKLATELVKFCQSHMEDHA